MLASVASAAVRGVESYLVHVEVSLGPGLPSFTVVGLPEGAVREGRERVTAALGNTGRRPPLRRVVVNLAPADVRKDGSALDLPIALALLAADGELAHACLAGWAFVGELGLDGALRPVRGVAAIAEACARAGLTGLLVPEANAGEAAAVGGIPVVGASDITAVLDHVTGRRVLATVQVDAGALLERAGSDATGHEDDADLADVRGQPGARRALEIAAAGGHNLLLIGPPGSGKTMLARRMSGILPRLSVREAREVTTVHSVAGRLRAGSALVTARPFRAPHHTVSDAGLIGGGSPPHPGEASLAHHGVLFLDELPEFRRHVLEALRQPLEEGVVALARAGGPVCFPARVVLVAAMNP